MIEKTNFLDKFIKITGFTRQEALYRLNQKHSSVLALNTLKCDNNELNTIAANPKLKKINEYEDVYEITGGKQVFTKSSDFLDGKFYIQNISSLLPVVALDPKPGEYVLDLCASPGGKSFNICRITKNKALLTVNEGGKHRLHNLKEIIKIYEMNIENILLSQGQGLYRMIETTFDKILLDAPCSAEGLITEIENENPKYWNQKKVKNLRNLQKKLLNSAYHLLKPGGTLVYSTCTYSPEENEEVIDWLLKTNKDMNLEKISEIQHRSNFVPASQKWEKKVFSKEMGNAIRILPDEMYEGFFIAKLKKSKL